MRLRLLLGVIVAAVAAAALVPVREAGGASGTCQTAGTTLAADGRARLYEGRFRTGLAATYGCFARGRSVRLGAGEEVVRFRLSRNFVAYFTADCIDGCRQDGVWVRNLRTGRGRGAPGEIAYDLVVTPRGTMAWTNARLEGNATFHDVWVLGQSGDRRRLDSDVELGSLALGGTTLYWKRGGVAQSAEIE